MSVFKMSGVEINTLLEEAQKSRLDATGGLDLTKPQFKGGAYLFAIRDARIVHKKLGTKESIQLACHINVPDTTNELFRDILYTFTVMSSESEHEKIGRSMLVEFLQRAFKYVLKPCNDENDLVNQVAQFKGKPFQAAVRVREWLGKGKPGEPALKLNESAEIWYTGHVDEEFNVDPTRLRKELSDADKARFAAAQSMAVQGPAESAFGDMSATSSSPANAAPAPSNDLPFDNDEPVF